METVIDPICKDCQKSFSRAETGRPFSTFCSKKCRLKHAVDKLPPKVCANTKCRKPFRHRLRKTKFCSLPCSHEHHRTGPTIVSFTCQNPLCGKGFERVDNPKCKPKFCSYDCSNAARLGTKLNPRQDKNKVLLS